MLSIVGRVTYMLWNGVRFCQMLFSVSLHSRDKSNLIKMYNAFNNAVGLGLIVFCSGVLHTYP